MYLFCTYYVPLGFMHKIGILILYLTENLEIFNVPFLCLFCAYFVPKKCAYFVLFFGMGYFQRITLIQFLF